MNKETEDFLKFVALVAIFLLIMLAALGRIRKLEKHIEELENAPTDTVTIIRVDTLRIAEPVPVYKYIKFNDTVTICHELRDTVKELVFLPREYMVYKDTNYRAVVSGVQPRLDSLELYPKTTVQTVTKYVLRTDAKRWGLGVNVGAGWNGQKISAYVGVGVQYNLVRW